MEDLLCTLSSVVLKVLVFLFYFLPDFIMFRFDPMPSLWHFMGNKNNHCCFIGIITNTMSISALLACIASCCCWCTLYSKVNFTSLICGISRGGPLEGEKAKQILGVCQTDVVASLSFC